MKAMMRWCQDRGLLRISEEEVIGWRRSMSSAYSSICEDDSGKRELVSLMVKKKSNGPRIDP